MIWMRRGRLYWFVRKYQRLQVQLDTCVIRFHKFGVFWIFWYWLAFIMSVGVDLLSVDEIWLHRMYWTFCSSPPVYEDISTPTWQRQPEQSPYPQDRGRETDKQQAQFVTPHGQIPTPQCGTGQSKVNIMEQQYFQEGVLHCLLSFVVALYFVV